MLQILTPRAGLGAAAAYRRDVAPRDGNAAFGTNDGLWLMVGALVDHAARATAEDAAVLLREAAMLAQPAMELSERFIFVGPIDDPDGRSDIEIIQRLIQRVEELGAFHLALSMLESLLVMASRAGPIVHGRVLAQWARVLWKLGEVDRSAAAYVLIGRLGRVHDAPELLVRRQVGELVLARHRGDVAAAARWSASATRLANRHNLPRLERLAVNGAFVAAAQARTFDDAIVQGWRLYELSRNDAISLAEILANLGMLLWDAGYPTPSRAAFRAALAAPVPPGVGFAALGGFALASSALHDTKSVLWAVGETERLGQEAPIPFHLATAMAECSAALFAIGEQRRAMSARNVALQIATTHGIRDVAERAATLGPSETDLVAAPFVLTAKASRVARKIASLEAPALPRHVLFVAAA